MRGQGGHCTFKTLLGARPPSPSHELFLLPLHFEQRVRFDWNELGFAQNLGEIALFTVYQPCLFARKHTRAAQSHIRLRSRRNRTEIIPCARARARAEAERVPLESALSGSLRTLGKISFSTLVAAPSELLMGRAFDFALSLAGGP